jgi:hypothetical protein
MKLKEIFEDGDLLFPNASTIEQKVRYFNQLQKQLFRDFPMPLESEQLQTESGINLYNIGIPIDRVKQVFINDIEYMYHMVDDQNQGYIYTFMDQLLFIQPTPTQVANGYILYEAIPVDMTVNDLDTEPIFLSDYHELFVLGLAQKFALVSQDYKVAGELEMRFQKLILRAMTKTKKGNIKKIRISRGWN